MLILLIACRPPADGELIDLDVVNEGPLTRVSWESPKPGPSWVEYGVGEFQLATPADEGGTHHELLVLGLVPNQDYVFRAFTAGENGVYEGAEGTLRGEPLPRGLQSWTATGDGESGGWLLTSVLQEGDSWVVILDREGEIVWYHQAPVGASIPTSSPSHDGRAIYYTLNDREQVADVSESVRVSLDLSEITATRTPGGHHGYAELPDGRHAWLSLELRDVEIEGGETLKLIGDRILETDEGDPVGGNADTVFSFFDDYAQPFRTCSHFDENGYNLQARDWTHTNSMLYDWEDDAFYVAPKNLDALLKVDRSTGEFLWQVGGRDSDVAVPEDGGWSHGHLSQVWDGGFMVFDNGTHRSPQVSAIREFAFDLEKGSLEEVFSYEDPQGRYVMLLGDARKLPGGTYLGAWTNAGLVTEVDADGELIWKLESPLGTAVARVTWLEDLYVLQ